MFRSEYDLAFDDDIAPYDLANAINPELIYRLEKKVGPRPHLLPGLKIVRNVDARNDFYPHKTVPGLPVYGVEQEDEAYAVLDKLNGAYFDKLLGRI